MTVTGSHRSTEGLQSSREKGPMPSRAQAPMASRVEMTCRAMWPDSSARAPALAPPMCKCAPGMGWLTVNAAVHVWPMLVVTTPGIETHARYPTLAWGAHGSTHAEAPMVKNVCKPMVQPSSPPKRASLQVQNWEDERCW